MNGDEIASVWLVTAMKFLAAPVLFTLGTTLRKRFSLHPGPYKWNGTVNELIALVMDAMAVVVGALAITLAETLSLVLWAKGEPWLLPLLGASLAASGYLGWRVMVWVRRAGSRFDRAGGLTAIEFPRKSVGVFAYWVTGVAFGFQACLLAAVGVSTHWPLGFRILVASPGAMDLAILAVAVVINRVITRNAVG